MKQIDTIRAWKDEAYREQLGAAAPQHPAGLAEVAEGDLTAIAGGTNTTYCTQWSGGTLCCC